MVMPTFVNFADKVKLLQGRHRKDSFANEGQVVPWYRRFVPAKILINFPINGDVFDRQKFIFIQTEEEGMNVRAKVIVKVQCIERGVEDGGRLVEDIAKAERV